METPKTALSTMYENFYFLLFVSVFGQNNTS